MKTILVIGDDSDWESFLKFKKKREFFRKNKISFKAIGYSPVLKGKLPEIKNKDILIFLFFPLDYWNNRIEGNFVKGRVYGDRKCALMFYDYLDKVKGMIDDRYRGKRLSYVNSFGSVKVDRDKELTKKVIGKAVPVPLGYPVRRYEDIEKLLSLGKRLYIKVNFGAMGKGITRLEKGKWVTNFLYRKGNIVSRKGDYGWKFNDITGRKNFLKKLLKKDVVVEEAIDPYVIRGKKFDIRYYVVYGKIKHRMIRSTSEGNVVTNITQGGSKEGKAFMRKIPKTFLKRAEKSAVEAARALRLNLAGIDVMISRKGIPYVIEAQSFPGFPASRHNFSEKLAKDIIRNWRCIEIRKAEKRDLKDILRLKLKLKKQDLEIDRYLKDPHETKELYKRYLIRDLSRQGQDRILFVAVMNNKVVGYVRGTLTRTLHVLNVRLRGTIDNLYVEKRYRGKGFAGQLVNELIGWFREKGVDVMTLHVYPSNSKAISLYRSFGFEEYTLNMSRKTG
ncbi:GNAT family N-acetyltransferase [Candidatus Woesearchaeota archaeon]|nr:GNAT family N-acetyltransferase [Candidatus Woesearchaeota archaeon]